MKTYNLILFHLFLSALCWGQEKQVSPSNNSMIDKYFTVYAKQPGYEVQLMGESMISRSNEMGMWKHPTIARIMKQVKYYKYLNIPVTTGTKLKMIERLNLEVQKDGLYHEYYKQEASDNTIIIYTKGLKIVTELVLVSDQGNRLNVSCFFGNHIDMDSVRALAGGH